MTVFEWPDVVGEEATSIPAHAANLKVDVANLHRLIHQGAESVPSEIFLQFSLSIQALLDKVLDQPDLDDIRRTIDRIDENTATILDRVSSSHGKDRPDDQQLAEAGFPQSENDKMTSKFASTPGTSQSTAYHVVEPGDSSSLVIRSNLTAEGNVHGQIYSPLDKTKNEIRVVAISPSIDSVFDISCDLSVVSLDEKPVYRALSYTWGDAKDTLPIRLNGHRFDVTRNLKQALQRLRSLGTDSTIWIDAICINQIDMEERMHQVQLMRCIYESPIEVLVYLGEPHGSYPTVQATMQDDNAWDHSLFSWTGDKSDVARINAILEYGQAYADTYPNAPDARTPDTLMLGICFLRLVAGDVHLTDIPLVANVNIRNLITSAMQMLTSMPWWNRIWVVQEVILPPAVKVLYGRFSLPLQMLSNASVHLEKHRTSCCKGILTVEKYQIDCFDALERKMSTIDQSSKLWREHARTTLMTILQLYYTKDATDPRDKVYGLLGLVRDWGNLEPTTPDYAISVGQLYEEVALQSIMISGTLDFLSYRAEKILQQAQYFEDLETMKRAILYHTDIPRDADDILRWDKEDAMNQGEPETVEFSYSSWATDWAAMSELGYEVIVAERISRLPLFNACGGRPATPPPQLFTSSRVLRRTAVLKVSAFRVGKVEFESENGADYSMPLLLHNDATFPTDETLPLPLRPKKAHKATYPNGSTRYEAICRAICGDTFYIESTHTSTQANESNFRRATPYDIASIALWRAWLHKSKSIHITQHIPPSAQDFSTEEEFTRVRDADRAIRSMGLLRRFIELDSGYVGMASHARPNDEVMVFMGAKTPFAVRKVGGVEVEGVGVKCVWVVIGECYVPGVMDGEFVEKMEEEGNVPEAIYLI